MNNDLTFGIAHGYGDAALSAHHHAFDHGLTAIIKFTHKITKKLKEMMKIRLVKLGVCLDPITIPAKMQALTGFWVGFGVKILTNPIQTDGDIKCQISIPLQTGSS